jgi:Rrf2 family protein
MDVDPHVIKERLLLFYLKRMLTSLLGYTIIVMKIPVNHWVLNEVRKLRLSTRGRYGLMAMFQLALEYGKGPIPLKNVANEQGLSESYLEQLFSTLRKDGLINSVRGAQGGYMLAFEPSEITVGQVLRSLEGDLSPADCVGNDSASDCSKEYGCATKLVLMEIKNSIDQVIDSISLKNMVDEVEKQDKRLGGL